MNLCGKTSRKLPKTLDFHYEMQYNLKWKFREIESVCSRSLFLYSDERRQDDERTEPQEVQ